MLAKSICEVRERMAVISSVEERMQVSAKEVMAEKESMERQLQSVLIEQLEQLRSKNTIPVWKNIVLWRKTNCSHCILAKDELEAHLSAAPEENQMAELKATITITSLRQEVFEKM